MPSYTIPKKACHPNNDVQGFRVSAKVMAGCDCGWAKPTHITHDGLFLLYHGMQPFGERIPEKRFCVHRQIEKALVRAYRKGQGR